MLEELHAQNFISKRIVKKALHNFLKDPSLKSASFSFLLTDLRTGKQVASFDEHRALVPASSQKIISTAFALNELSGEYKFKTPFFLKGILQSDSTFLGNLEVVGKGDPSFASDYFSEIPKIQNIADTLIAIFKSKGIKSIKGNILVNEQFITDIPENKDWLWYDLGNYYGAGCFAFNYADNQASISLEAAKQEGGICTIIKVQPSLLTSNYSSRVIGKALPLSTDVYVIGSSQSCKQEIRGEWKCCSEDTLTIRSALIKPSDVFVSLLKDALKNSGFNIQENNISSSQEGELIYTYSSPSLNDLAQHALFKSVNLYCESFVHLFGYKINGTTDRQMALFEMNKMLSGIITDEKSAVLEDGSGLSPKNMISASAFVEFLQWIHKNESLYNYWQLLPDIEVQGSLVKWLKPNKKKLLSMKFKSGSMERVRSYTGYIVHKDHAIYAMSLLVNHYACSGEKMNEQIAGFFNHILNNK